MAPYSYDSVRGSTTGRYATSCSQTFEPELRRLLDRAIGRALTDAEYAAVLIARPTEALSSQGYPMRCLELEGIHASSLRDFARQAREVFWPSKSAGKLRRHD
jgi:hypothetical protein